MTGWKIGYNILLQHNSSSLLQRPSLKKWAVIQLDHT
jgi:hypothetical protein